VGEMCKREEEMTALVDHPLYIDLLELLYVRI
jgi:hypothetical protein